MTGEPVHTELGISFAHMQGTNGCNALSVLGERSGTMLVLATALLIIIAAASVPVLATVRAK